MMDDLDAIMMIEQGDGDEDDVIAAWQALIDSGTVWHLQGSYQRGAMRLIEAGLCNLNKEPT